MFRGVACAGSFLLGCSAGSRKIAKLSRAVLEISAILPKESVRGWVFRSVGGKISTAVPEGTSLGRSMSLCPNQLSRPVAELRTDLCLPNEYSRSDFSSPFEIFPPQRDSSGKNPPRPCRHPRRVGCGATGVHFDSHSPPASLFVNNGRQNSVIVPY